VSHATAASQSLSYEGARKPSPLVCADQTVFHAPWFQSPRGKASWRASNRWPTPLSALHLQMHHPTNR
jgi:hypothetical protein